MVYTNFLGDGVAVNGAPLLPGGGTIPFGRQYFFVDSARGSDGSEGTADSPFATLDFAIGKCTANNGDVIVVMPNHAETITGAGGITADVAGITIVGIGVYNQRPRFLMDGAATVTFVISAADVTVQNLVFAAGHADVVTCFNITAVGAKIVECEFVQNVVDENFLTEIKATSTTNNNADGLQVIGCRAFSVDASAVEFIEINADLDGLVVMGNLVVKSAGTASPHVLCATGKDLTDCLIASNRHQCAMTTGDIFIDNDTTANNGIVCDNYVGHDDTASAVIIDLDGARYFNNYSSSSSTVSGVLLPPADDNT